MASCRLPPSVCPHSCLCLSLHPCCLFARRTELYPPAEQSFLDAAKVMVEGFERRDLAEDCRSRATALHMHMYNTTALKVGGAGAQEPGDRWGASDTNWALWPRGGCQ
jgi:hypothetical protein